MRIANYHIKSKIVRPIMFLFSYDNYQGMKRGKNKDHTDESVCIINAKCYLLNAICKMLFAKCYMLDAKC